MNTDLKEWAEKSRIELRRDIARGMLDNHLGRIFTRNEVFSRNPYYILRRKIKGLYWRLRIPIEIITHRNCESCKRYRRIIAHSTGKSQQAT